jgi:hypothetical protein
MWARIPAANPAMAIATSAHRVTRSSDIDVFLFTGRAFER